jgi:hypothetical protein
MTTAEDEAFLAQFMASRNQTGMETKAEEKKEFTKMIKTSNFIITVDPHYCESELATIGQAREKYMLLKVFADKLVRNSKNGIWIKPKGNKLVSEWIRPSVTEFKVSVERGHLKGKMHFHLMIMFNGECHMDVKKIREAGKLHFNLEGGIHLDVKSFTDTKKLMESYVSKHITAPGNFNMNLSTNISPDLPEITGWTDDELSRMDGSDD